ncbi:MAG: cation-translocating P-type ATPase [Planctomycetes bacterium]|nr:cation-translocating P-type ATPase [Planctomycetota bacterium]
MTPALDLLQEATESAACAHCGLPVAGRAARPSSAPRAPLFCCGGCRMASAASGGGGAVKFLEARLVLSAFFAAGTMEFSLVLYGDAIFGASEDPAAGSLHRVGQFALVFFSLPVLLLLVPPILRGAWLDARAGHVRTDGLIVIATAAAWGLSVWHVWKGQGEVYFETATMLLVLFAFGRRLEAYARVQGRDAAKTLLECLPEKAHRLPGDGGTAEDVPHAALAVGDRVRVAPGEFAPADLVVESGESDVRAAHVTGEEAPRSVGPGDLVPAGAVNGGGALVARVERTGADGSLGRILSLLDQPLPETRTTRMMDRLATWLVVVSVALAIGGGVRSASIADGSVGAGLRTAVSVLLVACPCALGLATPLAFRAMRAALARRGVLVRDPAALEVAATADRVLLDKTGTLTDVTTTHLEREAGPDDAIHRLERLVAHSGHALASAVNGPRGAPENLVAVPGFGVRGRVDGIDGRAGSPAWMDRDGLAWDDAPLARRAALAAAGTTLVAYAENGRVTALASVRQELRPGAAQAVARLRELGLEVEILSGDNDRAVADVADRIGAAGRGSLTPEGKVRRIEELRAAGECVVMAGDGVNDAPALRAADVSIALACGTAAARSQAQVEVLGDDFAAVPRFIEASRALRRNIRGNLAWNVAYNTVALGLAAMGKLHPLLAVGVMIGSSLAASVRSYRLLDWGRGR